MAQDQRQAAQPGVAGGAVQQPQPLGPARAGPRPAAPAVGANAQAAQAPQPALPPAPPPAAAPAPAVSTYQPQAAPVAPQGRAAHPHASALGDASTLHRYAQRAFADFCATEQRLGELHNQARLVRDGQAQGDYGQLLAQAQQAQAKLEAQLKLLQGVSTRLNTEVLALTSKEGELVAEQRRHLGWMRGDLEHVQAEQWTMQARASRLRGALKALSSGQDHHEGQQPQPVTGAVRRHPLAPAVLAPGRGAAAAVDALGVGAGLEALTPSGQGLGRGVLRIDPSLQAVDLRDVVSAVGGANQAGELWVELPGGTRQRADEKQTQWPTGTKLIFTQPGQAGPTDVSTYTVLRADQPVSDPVELERLMSGGRALPRVRGAELAAVAADLSQQNAVARWDDARQAFGQGDLGGAFRHATTAARYRLQAIREGRQAQDPAAAGLSQALGRSIESADPRPTDDPLLRSQDPAVLNGRWVPMRVVGRSELFTTYAAYDRELGRTVALKLARIDSDGVALDADGKVRVGNVGDHDGFCAWATGRLQPELTRGSAGVHPNLVQFIPTGPQSSVVVEKASLPGGSRLARAANGLPFLVQELVEGPTLQLLLERGELGAPSSEEEQARRLRLVLSTLYGVTDGLSEIHRRGFVHRDVKPANVGLHRVERGSAEARRFPFGLPKVFDFGNLHIQGTRHSTSPNEVIGTPPFMSPEHLRNEPASFLDDQCAVGHVGFALLNGRAAFDDGSDDPGKVYAEMAQNQFELPPLPGWVPSDVQGLIRRLAAPNEGSRFASDDEALFAIHRLLVTHFGRKAGMGPI